MQNPFTSLLLTAGQVSVALGLWAGPSPGSTRCLPRGSGWISLGVWGRQSPWPGEALCSALPRHQQLHQPLSHLVLPQQRAGHWQHPAGVTGTEPCRALGTGSPVPPAIPRASLLTPHSLPAKQRRTAAGQIRVGC